MSQVSYYIEPVDLKRVILTTSHIVITEPINKCEVHKVIKFPVETYYLNEESTDYVEEVLLYKVKSVLFSKNIKLDQIIKVLINNDYGVSSMQIWHETGVLESPVVSVSKSKWNVLPDENSIMFLRDYEGVYEKSHTEGLAGELEIAELIKSGKIKGDWSG